VESNGHSVVFEDLRPGTTILKNDSMFSQQTWNHFCREQSVKSEHLESLHFKKDIFSQLEE